MLNSERETGTLLKLLSIFTVASEWFIVHGDMSSSHAGQLRRGDEEKERGGRG